MPSAQILVSNTIFQHDESEFLEEMADSMTEAGASYGARQQESAQKKETKTHYWGYVIDRYQLKELVMAKTENCSIQQQNKVILDCISKYKIIITNTDTVTEKNK